jgi:transposase
MSNPKLKVMENSQISMQIINPFAGGIDVGSRSHFVAIGQESHHVKEFGVFAEDLRALANWLIENNISTVAMESTGTYWQNLFATLQESGLDVILCNGKFTKNIKGKKTDVQDCQWIQRLHTLGLLSSSFLPDIETEKLRTFCRHRSNLIRSAASTTKKMQKYLRLMNLRLEVVVRDITGLTGLLIIDAICKGEKNPETLSELRHGNCRKTKEEIAKALHSNGREDYLFALQQEYELYQVLQNKITDCDVEIEKIINLQINSNEVKSSLIIESKPHKRVNKNAPQNIDLNLKSYQYFEGIDLMAIEGVSHNTIMAIMSEVGLEGFKKFETAKQFASWLRLCPNNKISGGKVLSSKIPKGSNRLKIALRNAANAIGNLKNTHLSDFFNRVSYRRGRHAAVSATARKLAIIIWNMIVKKLSYAPPSEYEYLDQKRKRKVKEMQKQILKLGITADELCVLNT